jgi:hypothetical protein
MTVQFGDSPAFRRKILAPSTGSNFTSAERSQWQAELFLIVSVAIAINPQSVDDNLFD